MIVLPSLTGTTFTYWRLARHIHENKGWRVVVSLRRGQTGWHYFSFLGWIIWCLWCFAFHLMNFAIFSLENPTNFQYWGGLFDGFDVFLVELTTPLFNCAGDAFDTRDAINKVRFLVSFSMDFIFLGLWIIPWQPSVPRWIFRRNVASNEIFGVGRRQNRWVSFDIIWIFLSRGCAIRMKHQTHQIFYLHTANCLNLWMKISPVDASDIRKSDVI